MSISDGSNILPAVVGAAAGTAVGIGVGYAVGHHTRKKKKSYKRKSKYKNHYRRRKQRQPHTAGKRKDTSHRRIRWTKNNRPYIIMGNGRAKFISMKSARLSRKRKGGRY